MTWFSEVVWIGFMGLVGSICLVRLVGLVSLGGMLGRLGSSSLGLVGLLGFRGRLGSSSVGLVGLRLEEARWSGKMRKSPSLHMTCKFELRSRLLARCRFPDHGVSGRGEAA